MKEVLRPLIKSYISNWNYINNFEDYKWYALKHFKENFFGTGNPLMVRLEESLSRHVNLLDIRKYFPLAMLTEVGEEKTKEVEMLITDLFDESMPLKERIVHYMVGFDSLVKIMAEEGHSDWKGRDNLQSFQDAHAISVYLSMRYPNRYYIYKYGVFKEFSRIVGYRIQHKDKIDRCIEFFQLCEKVKELILCEKSFISFYDSWLKAHGFDDRSYNLLTQDFIYSVAVYLSTYAKNDKSKTIVGETIHIDAHEFTSIEQKVPKSFRGIKDIDYADKDSLFNSLGLLGEKWTIIYEQNRLADLGILFEVRHSSIYDGDGVGYDILSVEDDGITPRYIEVKTTTGGINQPFFFTDNELLFSELRKSNYYVYRVFNFKDIQKKADLLIIHGSLKELNAQPTVYKVSVKKVNKQITR